MKKFYLVSGCILVLLILAMVYRTFAVNNKTNLKEISSLTEQVTSLKTELKDLQALKDDLKRQGSEIKYLKEELQDLKLAIQSLQFENEGLGKIWDSGSSTRHKDKPDSGQVPSSSPLPEEISEEVLKNPEFAKLFKQAVEQTMAEIREKEQAERQQRRTEMMNNLLQRRIDRYAKDLNLSDYQKEEMGKIIGERNKKIQDMFSNLRSGEPEREQMQAEMDKIRKDTNDKLQLILDPHQYDQYQKMESEQRRPFREPGQRTQEPEQKEKQNE